MSNKIKILVISQVPWREENSVGNSFSNIFGGIENIEIANIYCGVGLPNTNLVKNFYQTNERMLLKNILSKKNKAGFSFHNNDLLTADHVVSDATNDVSKFKFFQKNRLLIFLWFREIIWRFGRWKSPEMKKFIDDFNPDIIFLPIFYPVFMNRIGLFVRKYSNKKMVGYISDDHYTLQQYSLNPFFWIDRLINRSFVKKAIDACEILYVISEIQKNDYDKCFQKNCKILYKGANFDKQVSQIKNKVNLPIQFLFSGNIIAGRYKTLGEIGIALDKINSNGVKAILTIYTNSVLTNDMIKVLSCKSIQLKEPVSYTEILKIQANSDVLVHVESFNKKERLLVRQSFSTKIVDYLYTSKCIFAVGTTETASINYLLKNNAAIIATDSNEIEQKLLEIINNTDKIDEFGKLAYDCGMRNHQIKQIQNNLYNDFLTITNQ
jgi:hypothetical protein